MNDKMRITIEIPNTGLEENILRKGEWDDNSLFGISLRGALMHFTKESFCLNCVLDKLRAEIDKIYEREGNSVDCLNALDELKCFIDKYKAESEVEE